MEVKTLFCRLAEEGMIKYWYKYHSSWIQVENTFNKILFNTISQIIHLVIKTLFTFKSLNFSVSMCILNYCLEWEILFVLAQVFI